MRCKKHPSDFSSAVGVCASCLRERLLAIMATQAQAQLMQAQMQLGPQDRGNCRKSGTAAHRPPSLAFPRSVSPYISRRKSDNAAAWQMQGQHDQRFYSTPQVGPTGSMTVGIERSRKGSGGRFFSLLSGIFRLRRGKTGADASGPISDPGVSGSFSGYSTRDPCTSSPFWLSAALPSRRKKVNTYPIEVSVAGDRRRAFKDRGRGMSPARFSDDEDDEHCRGGSSGYSSESSQGWRQTPRRTPDSTRSGGGRAAPPLSKNMSGLTFCLSPLVRASPNRHRNQKGVPPELMTAGAPGGDVRAPMKPHLSAASSFCKNRSRKLADFGRYNPNY